MEDSADRKTSKWHEVTAMMDKGEVTLGRYMSYWFEKTPRRALNYLSYYKFAAKMIGKSKKVLDVGCNEGFGTWTIAAECGFAKGIDLDEEAIEIAKMNWRGERIEFCHGDFFEAKPQDWDAVVSFDVVEHILPSNIEMFFTRIKENLKDDGIAIIGTPNQEGQRYASDVSRKGHVNVYSFERLEEEMSRHFHHVFMFCGNDEVIHTGYPKMAHYLISIGCRKRGEKAPS